MITRYVFIKLDDEHANDEGRSEAAQQLRTALAGVPQVEGWAVGVPADPASEGSWDLGLQVHFANLDDLALYIDHPVHRDVVDTWLKPRMVCIKAWNFHA